MTLPPILVIVAVHVDGKEIFADLQIGPRRERLVIDLSIPDFIEYKEIPAPLNSSLKVKRALFDVMERVYRGESVGFPLDLSSATRDVNEGWPLRPEPDKYKTAERVDVQLTKALHNSPEQGMTTAELLVLGMPTVVIIDEQDGPKDAPRFRFVSGVHPWQLTDAAAWSMLLTLAAAMPR